VKIVLFCSVHPLLNLLHKNDNLAGFSIKFLAVGRLVLYFTQFSYFIMREDS